MPACLTALAAGSSRKAHGASGVLRLQAGGQRQIEFRDRGQRLVTDDGRCSVPGGDKPVPARGDGKIMGQSRAGRNRRVACCESADPPDRAQAQDVHRKAAFHRLDPRQLARGIGVALRCGAVVGWRL